MRTRASLLAVAFVSFAAHALAAPPAQPAPPKPPVAPKVPHTLALHGETLEDEYFWLREKGTPRVDAYLRAEADYAKVVMAPTEKLQATLYDELRSRMAEDDSSAPFSFGGPFLYYTRVEAGKQYPIVCRRRAGRDGTEQILLDINQLGAKEKYIALGQWFPSPDEKRLAYSTDQESELSAARRRRAAWRACWARRGPGARRACRASRGCRRRWCSGSS